MNKGASNIPGLCQGSNFSAPISKFESKYLEILKESSKIQFNFRFAAYLLLFSQYYTKNENHNRFAATHLIKNYVVVPSYVCAKFSLR